MILVEAVFAGLAMETIRSSRTRSKASRNATRAASVARAREPPSALRGRLPEKLPAAEAPLGIEAHLAVYEGPDLVVGPRHAAGDVTHDLGVGGDGAEFRPIRALPNVEHQPFGFEDYGATR
jgi:hypothetical protein